MPCTHKTHSPSLRIGRFFISVGTQLGRGNQSSKPFLSPSWTDVSSFCTLGHFRARPPYLYIALKRGKNESLTEVKCIIYFYVCSCAGFYYIASKATSIQNCIFIIESVVRYPKCYSDVFEICITIPKLLR